MKIWLLKISEAFVFEVGSTGYECTPGWIFAADPYFPERAILASTRWNIQCAMENLKYRKRAKEWKLHTLVENHCREPL